MHVLVFRCFLAAWENFLYSCFGTMTLIPAETVHSFLELLFWHKI
ncbi:Uncharacterized protein APZ42_002810 [Daphnia magna]|uniref:Uncharacterized protein n=1 Tax=Daphnia magna TaxID=35525 RepID=A0A164I114_9CRUS|nr:Uncharacterized protein APZ42_002810 [Daphnia magna]